MEQRFHLSGAILRDSEDVDQGPVVSNAVVVA